MRAGSGGRGPASEAVREEWGRRVEAEYRSAALAQELGLWLLQIGASPDLVTLAQRAARDELAHAAHARRVLAAAGGGGAIAIDRGSLALSRGADPLEADVLRATLTTFCLGETLAVRLFARLREKCTVPVARRALDRVLKDEVRHRDLGWLVLEALIHQAPWVRAVAARELPDMVLAFVGLYAPEAGRSLESIPKDDRAWGLMAPADYARVVAASLPRDHAPRFARLGIDAGPSVEAALARLGAPPRS